MPDLVSDDAAETTPEKVVLGPARESEDRFVPQEAFHDERGDGVDRHLDDSALVVGIEQYPAKRRVGHAARAVRPRARMTR
jgi:CO/xanthine dehydrogenase FAD-binding subunit